MEDIIEEKLTQHLRDNLELDSNFDVSQWNHNLNEHKEEVMAEIFQQACVDEKYRDHIRNLVINERERIILTLKINRSLQRLFITNQYMDIQTRTYLIDFFRNYNDLYTLDHLTGQDIDYIDKIGQIIAMLKSSPLPNPKDVGNLIMNKIMEFLKCTKTCELQLFDQLFNDILSTTC